MGKADFFKAGDWNGICDRCGKKFKFSKLKHEWTGLTVCSSCLDYRHPQEFVRALKDTPGVPQRASESPDMFVPGVADLPLPPQLPELD